jgi:hypothetical protein
MTKRKKILSTLSLFAILGLLLFLAFPFNATSTTTTPALYGSYDAVPTADGVANTYSRDVVGNKTDAAAAGAVTTTESIMAYVKQLVGGVIASDTVVDAILVDTGTTIPGTITTVDGNVDSILVDTGTTIPATIATAQSDLDVLTGATGANLLTATQASIDAIEVDTQTTIPATITTAQNDLDIITGASGVNLLTATQASIDAIEVDTETTIPATITTLQDSQEISVVSSAAVMVNGDTIFTIAGGPIEVLSLVSISQTLCDATASTVQYSADPTVGAAITFSGASATLANFAAGGSVVLNMTALDTAPDLSVVAVSLGPVRTRTIIVNEGIVTVVIGTGSTTGTFKHYLRYRPLGPGVTVTGT